MARVTVEDCIEKIPNRFELVLTAGQRARAIQKGEILTIDRDNDKNPVVALREIADETIDPDKLRDDIVKGLQKLTNPEFVEDEEDENLDNNGLEDDYTINDDYIHPVMQEPILSLIKRLPAEQDILKI